MGGTVDSWQEAAFKCSRRSSGAVGVVRRALPQAQGTDFSLVGSTETCWLSEYADVGESAVYMVLLRAA